MAKAGRKPKKRRHDQAKAQQDRAPNSSASFPIVGVGASAGGLEAFTKLLNALPLDTGMGFVLIQHLDPDHDSALTQILSRATSMPVIEIENDQPVLRNQVHVIPRDTNLTIEQGVLKLAPRPKGRAPHKPIDTFFESLAQDQRERAIGVVLSGTASDGTLGLEVIKAEGGFTFAQDDTAKHDSMPRSAVAAGCVDLVLSPTDISKELARIAKHPYSSGKISSAKSIRAEDDRAEATAHEHDAAPLPPGEGETKRGGGGKRARLEAARVQPQTSADGHKKILLLLRNHSGVDFSLYKSTTIQRRINRRMILTRHDSLGTYATFLRGNAQELDALYSDVLISVTSFFRNPEMFAALQRTVLPEMLKQRGDGPLRCWVLGCSTGQEAYSIAMAFVEAADKVARARSLQIFATDLNEALLAKARHGLYAKSLAEDLTPERLRRFFVEEDGGYRVTKSLREMVVFARQNLISDPPFSRMDLISCRNLLIYLEPSLQKKALPTFHYALKPSGFLLLGASESIGTFTDLFEPVDKKHKIYSGKSAATPASHLPVTRTQLEPSRRNSPKPAEPRETRALAEFSGGLNAQREADRITINQFSPPGVLVNADLQILQFRGPTGAYLQPPAGKATLDVLKMSREGLMLPLRSALSQAKKTNKAARKENIRIKHDGHARLVNIEVIPLKNVSERGFLILFSDASRGTRRDGRPQANEKPTAALSRKQELSRVAELEAELAETREYLQAMQEQHEAANEELQAANEEVQSTNEELQSINEELETSKEELESANEELMTVNEEMAARNLELGRLNNDLINLQTSTRLAIVLLGRDLTIRRFSPQAQKQFDLLATDLGRPVAHLRHHLLIGAAEPSPLNLESFASEVISSVREQEHEAYDEATRRWYSLRIRPYVTLDNKIDGAVLVLVDIDALKQNERAILLARDLAENVIATVREPLLVLDAALRVESANPSFYRVFQVAQEATIGRSLFDLGNGQWAIPRLRELLTEVLPQRSTVEDFEVEYDSEQVGKRIMLLNARRLADPQRHSERIVVAIEDITERAHMTEALRASNTQLQTRADELGRFNQAAIDRELRMIELKREINDLCRHHGEVARYRIDGDAEQDDAATQPGGSRTLESPT